jgi:predicted acetyltransferase
MKLERPDVKYKTSFIAGFQEFQVSGSQWDDVSQLTSVNLETDFETYVQSRLWLADSAQTEPGTMPRSEYWLMEELEFVGRALTTGQKSEGCVTHAKT